MKNLWCIFGIYILVYLTILIYAIVLLVKKDKHYTLKVIFLISLVILCFTFDICYIKDITKQETTEVVAVYVEYRSRGNRAGTVDLFFKDGTEEFVLLSPKITREYVDLEKGKMYKVVYFNNSKVIKEIIVVEEN